MAAHEQVGARALSEARGGLMPKVQRIERCPLEVQHAVVFGNEVQISSSARNTSELGDHAVRVRNGMKHVAAHGEIEAAVSGFEFENTLMLECQTRRQTRVAPTREFQVLFDDVNSEH